MDLNSAFLLGELNEDISMLPSPDFHDRNGQEFAIANLYTI